MGKEKKCAIGCCVTLVILVVIIGTGIASWYLALSETGIESACNALKLFQSQVCDQ